MIVIEAGRYFRETEFDGAELSGFNRLDLNGGGMASVEGSVGLLAGQGVGGTMLINCTFSFRTPDFDLSLGAVWERIGVNPEHSVPSRRDESIRESLDELGWEWEVMPRNVGLHRGGLPATA